jgi:hypothetical protein
MMHIRTVVAVSTIAVTCLSGAWAAESPAPKAVLLRTSALDFIRSATASLQSQPKRVVRLPSRESIPLTVPRQEVIPVRRSAPAGMNLLDYCAQHPLLADTVSGNVTPRGTIVIHGLCFGATAGDAVMLGTFPGGAVRLAVSSWTDDTVTASIPPISGVTDQLVQLRLVSLQSTFRGLARTASEPLRSQPLSAHFIAARETTIARQDWVVNVRCGAGGQTVDNLDSCDSYTAASGGWFDETHAERIVYHIRRNAPGTSGQDDWQTRLPAGWSFDRIEFISSSPGTAIDITPTVNNAAVAFRVQWKTQHAVDGGPHEEGAYTMAVFASGPAGTQSTIR